MKEYLHNDYYERLRDVNMKRKSVALPEFENSCGKIPAFYSAYSKPCNENYFFGKSGLYWEYGCIANFIFKCRKDLIGLPAIKQLKEIGLEDEFNGGVTSAQIPLSF